MATITLTCQTCGITKEVKNRPERNQRYCSSKCAGRAAIQPDSKTRYLGAENTDHHRRIAEKALGKPLPDGAEIHHVDGNGKKNANTNLVICEDHRYHKLLHVRQRIADASGDPNTQKICCTCRLVLNHDQFHRDKHAFDGLSGACIQCALKKSITYYYRRGKHRRQLRNARSHPIAD